MRTRTFLLLGAGVTALPAVLFGGWVALMAYNPGGYADRVRDAAATREEAAREGMVTRDRYDALSEGMAYEDVRDLIGRGGTPLLESQTRGVSRVRYRWVNPDGSSVQAVFVNGKLTYKAATGRLPE